MRNIFLLLAIQIGFSSFGQMNIKEVNHSLAKVNDSLYASKFEVSNKQYSCFINSLKTTKKNDILEIAQIDSTKWHDSLSNDNLYTKFYHNNPAFGNYPVLNISHLAAIKFCEWLTDEYNSSDFKKYKKVKFRLPTEQEWIMAASGEDNGAIYPWKGNELINKKGLLMCNFLIPTNDSLGIAGSITNTPDKTVLVKYFYPNNLGLYNMSGNAAEMLSDRNIVKGGSWSDKAEFMTISSKQEYDGSAKRTVGFRYFLEIIEK
jgi:formylglycine-generating enzyme required for sulfatase activity